MGFATVQDRAQVEFKQVGLLRQVGCARSATPCFGALPYSKLLLRDPSLPLDYCFEPFHYFIEHPTPLANLHPGRLSSRGEVIILAEVPKICSARLRRSFTAKLH